MPELSTPERRDTDGVGRVLRPWLAERLGGRLGALQVAPPNGHGFSNDTLLVSAEVDGSPMPLVVQAAPTGPGLFQDYRIDVMANVQRDLREYSDVPVANVRWLEEDSSLLGAPFYVMDRIDGRVPDESPMPYHGAGWLSEANSAERRILWTSVIEAIGKLARVQVDTRFEYLTQTRWGMPLDADAAAVRVRQWRDWTIWSVGAGKPPASLMGAWDRLEAALPARAPRLGINWGDAKLGNVMFRGLDVAALLDWELVGIGPAEEDLMNLLAVDHVLSTVGPGLRLDGLLSRDESVSVFETTLGRDLVGADWWYVFALAKMAAETHRLLLQWQGSGRVPEDLDVATINVTLPPLREALQNL